MKSVSSVDSAVDFVQSLDLPYAGPQLEGVAEPVTFSDKPEVATVGAQVTEFSAQVAPPQRAAVADCLLLAQLAANKATTGNPDQMAWYRKYVEVLQNIGWTVEEMTLQERQLEDTGLDVHKAIIPVLAAVLGPAVAVASMIIAVLKGLQEMDNSSPWITLFDRASQHASGATFQFGYVDATPGADPAIAIKLLAVAIDANRTITQVLFFKISNQESKLRTADGRLGIVGSRLDSIKGAVADRVLPFLADNISKLDL